MFFPPQWTSRDLPLPTQLLTIHTTLTVRDPAICIPRLTFVKGLEYNPTREGLFARYHQGLAFSKTLAFYRHKTQAFSEISISRKYTVAFYLCCLTFCIEITSLVIKNPGFKDLAGDLCSKNRTNNLSGVGLHTTLKPW